MAGIIINPFYENRCRVEMEKDWWGASNLSCNCLHFELSTELKGCRTLPEGLLKKLGCHEKNRFRKFFSFSPSPINWEKESEDEGVYGITPSSVPTSRDTFSRRSGRRLRSFFEFPGFSTSL